tara:strand:- start:11 stop:517 length:507 start_codon:yes stop_codon:yes gene_type:complete
MTNTNNPENNLEGLYPDEFPTDTGFGAIPPGEYTVVITDCVLKIDPVDPNDASKFIRHMIKFEYQITDGEYSGRTLKDNLNIVNKNEMAVKIANTRMGEKVAAISEKPSGTDGFIGKEMNVILKIKKGNLKTDGSGDSYPDGNNIVKFLKKNIIATLETATEKPSWEA